MKNLFISSGNKFYYDCIIVLSTGPVDRIIRIENNTLQCLNVNNKSLSIVKGEDGRTIVVDKNRVYIQKVKK